MKIILARHGNTFGPGDTPVWVGANEDLELVEKGKVQSVAIGQWLIEHNLQPGRIIAGPLKRTRLGADIISEIVSFDRANIRIDERLREIDYGSWGGKSDAEIEAQYGAEVIEDWREHTIVPEGADWTPSPDDLRQQIKAVLSELVSGGDEINLLVTSNGNLRYFHENWYEGANEAPSAKVKTGHICVADWNGSHFIPKCWNVDPNSDL